MTCDQIRPYLPGFVGGDLRVDTTEVVSSHVDGCAGCSAEATALRRVPVALATLSTREVEPPAFLADSIIEAVEARRGRRVLPVFPVPAAGDLLRAAQDHRETITSAAGTALVAAGAAYALWRAVRGTRRSEPATA